MSIINVLDKDIYNKIAAGEVVEKPASVVKELVENSIDAGATHISIDIVDGGISQIKVSDNGCGIAYDDFNKVFLPHATSKIKTVDDLFKIATLGFRGEALSSIASVSKVTLASKTASDESGYQLKISGGDESEIIPIGATQGTYIIVEDLFYNIPARKKFLRKPKLEENDITNYIARLILANPNISIKYSADNKIVYQSFGTGLYDAIYSIYGKSIVDNIIEINFKKGDYCFSGYIGKPTYSKPNRTYQTLIINGRYVINQTISTAIYKSYENFLMKGNFPFFVIHLNIPLDKIDVNVHPNKLDVKFENSNELFGIVYQGINDILYDINNTKIISTQEEQINFVDTSKLVDVSNIGTSYTPQNNDEIKEVSLTNTIEYEINKLEKEITQFANNYTNIPALNTPYNTIKDTTSFEFKLKTNPIDNTVPASNIQEILTEKISNITEKISMIEDLPFKFIGSVFDTYIVIEKNDKLLFMDQHAGHEKILFDKFQKELEGKEVAIQPLLIPHIIDVNYTESSFIQENLDTFKLLGFEMEEFGQNSYKVTTVPVLFENVDLTEFFEKMLGDLDNKVIISKSDTIREYLAKSACKAAIKGNYILNNDEIKVLVNQITEGHVLLCPHGRPIFVEVSKKEIEKWFKRIV